MKPVLDWLDSNHDRLVRDLAQLVAVPSISTDGEHQMEVEKTAALTCEFMKRAGLHNVAVLRCNGSNPYAYGEWLDAPGQPTLFLYAHHDVQPVNFLEKWQSPPWKLTSRSGRLFGRGAADDKGAIVAQLAAIAAFLQTTGSLPVNIKMLVEGEEEVGSRNLLAFLQAIQGTSPFRRDCGVRHGKHPGRRAQYHLLVARRGESSGRGSQCPGSRP